MVLGATCVVGCIEPPPTDVPAGTLSPEAGAPVVLWEAKTVDALYRPGEVRTYEFRQGGRLIGRSWGRYDGPDGDLHGFTTRIELEMPDRMPIRSEGRIFVQADGELVRGNERSDAAELTFRVKDELLELRAGDQSEQLSFAKGTAYMAYMATLHEELMYGTRMLTTGEMQLRLVSLSGASPSEWSARIVDRGAGTVELVTNLGERVEFRQGRIRRIVVEADELEVVSVDGEAGWPEWEIAGPKRLRYSRPAGSAFTRRELELPGRPGEPKLSGEALVPNKGKGPYPAAIFIAGSGLADRYGFAGPPPVDLGSHEITDALANAGFVVMRYDERGFGGSDKGELSWEAQLEDARRALRTLLVQPEVDPKKVILVGHGEGGWKAMRLVLERKKMCRGVALLATPGRKYEDILRANAEAMIGRLDEKSQKEARKQHQELVRRLKAGEDVPEEFRTQAQWLRGVLAEDPAKLVAKVDCPIWIAQGSKDFEVDPAVAPKQLALALKRSKKRYLVAKFGDLDHLFKSEPGTSRPRRYLEERPVDAAFLRALTTWAQKRAK
jgi:pimeloyl-ACP methyl ester carboxylesterase